MMSKKNAHDLYDKLTAIQDNARIGELLKRGVNFVPKNDIESDAHLHVRAFMNEFEITPAQPSIQICEGIELIPSNITPAPDPLKRRDLFTKDTDIYMLTSVNKQNNHKLAAFNLRVQNAIDTAREIYSDNNDMIIPIDWVQSPDYGQTPTVTIHLDCPDAEMDPRADKIIQTLTAAKQSGVRIVVKVLGNNNSAWAKTLPIIFGDNNNPFNSLSRFQHIK